LNDWRRSALVCGGLPPLCFIASLLAMKVATQIAGVEYKPTGSELPEKQSGSQLPHSKGGPVGHWRGTLPASERAPLGNHPGDAVK